MNDENEILPTCEDCDDSEPCGNEDKDFVKCNYFYNKFKDFLNIKDKIDSIVRIHKDKNCPFHSKLR